MHFFDDVFQTKSSNCCNINLKKKRGEEIPHGSMCPSGFRVDDLGSSAISRWEQLFDVGSTESLGPRQKSASAIFFLPETRWWFRIFCIFTPIWGRFPF